MGVQEQGLMTDTLLNPEKKTGQGGEEKKKKEKKPNIRVLVGRVPRTYRRCIH